MDLVSKSWLDQHVQKLENWKQSAYNHFTEMICDESHPYPCVPGKIGFQDDNLRFGFVDDPRETASCEQLASLLKSYGKVSRETGKYASLVVFCDSRSIDPSTSIETYQDLFWSILNGVHEIDQTPWPEHIPTDPHDSAWEFCFDGEPYFAFCATPAHSVRKSRKFPYFLLAFQPRFVFDEINASTSLGQKLKKAIRRRLISYDGVDPHPNLKWYGQKDNHEWKQYFLSDDESTPSKCPFTAMMNKMKSLRP
ncbi:YqcI/YcgG family protein [Fictibacillus nanhaiensis]|uniref:YqcI/YcgG family protein n=1 Tax=Fictibacillus nanhaiensis TaxID=742169 RepID=UPI001C94CFAC|nr:YqcI/YcgG family protein [Fictibacillus nanhaiensis]MBY6036584.1 YqcI/YcgG family protein [Fictibacillus nanhaiensis]